MLLDQDITHSTIAVLLGTPSSSPKALSKDDFEKILRGPVSFRQTINGGLAVTSARAKMEMSLMSNKLEVRDLSGDEPTKKALILEALTSFRKSISAPVVAYGLNYDITFRLHNKLPGEWIAEKLVSIKEIKKRTDFTVDFAAVILHMPQGNKMWNLRVEARGGFKGNRVRVDLNVHEDTKKLPGKTKLAQEFESEYERLIEFLSSLTK